MKLNIMFDEMKKAYWTAEAKWMLLDQLNKKGYQIYWHGNDPFKTTPIGRSNEAYMKTPNEIIVKVAVSDHANLVIKTDRSFGYDVRLSIAGTCSENGNSTDAVTIVKDVQLHHLMIVPMEPVIEDTPPTFWCDKCQDTGKRLRNDFIGCYCDCRTGKRLRKSETCPKCGQTNISCGCRYYHSNRYNILGTFTQRNQRTDSQNGSGIILNWISVFG